MVNIIHGEHAESPDLYPEQKQLAFDVAKHLKKSCFKLRTVWFDDVERWALVCTAMIDGIPYDSCNFLDDYSAKDHADMFRSAFSNALRESERAKGIISTLH